MKLYKFFILFIVISSCAPVQVNYDYEKTTNFSKYRTYNYYPDMQTGLSELDTKRLLDVLDAQMKQKNMSLSTTPDFYIDIKSSEYQNMQQNSVGVGIGGSGSNVGGGVSFGIPVGQTNIKRQIVFDFIDEKGVGLFWQAVTESSYNQNTTPDKRESVLQQIVAKALEGYPPK